MRIASLTILCLALAAVPAWAQNWSYDNGPINGTTDAWTINFGYIVSDTFIADGSTSVTGFSFGVWEFPGDTMSSVDWSITSGENGGTVFGSGTASGTNLTDKFISTNQYGYDIDLITVTGLNVATEQAAPPTGSTCRTRSSPAATRSIGMRTAAKAAVATAARRGLRECRRHDSFGSFHHRRRQHRGTTPEPSSIMLFGSGILGLAGVLRRKLF